MTSALYFAVGALCLAFAAWQVSRQRRPITGVPLAVATAALGVALVCGAPPAQSLESRLWLGLGKLLSNVATMVAAYGISLLTLVLATGEMPVRRIRWRLVALLVAIACLVGLFFASHVDAAGVFAGRYHNQPLLAIYSLVYSGFLGVVVVSVGLLSVRTVGAARDFLRAGLVMIGVACVLGLANLASKVVEVVRELLGVAPAGVACGGPFSGAACTLSVGMPALSVLVLVGGLLLPAAGPRAVAGVQWVAAWWAYHRLRTLWEALVAAVPDIALPQAARGAPLRFRLYRRVIEIRDGILILQPDSGGGLRPGGDPSDAAASLRAALREQAAGPHSVAGPASGQQLGARRAPADLRVEVTWLCQVARHFGRDDDRPAR